MTAYYNEIDAYCAQWLRNLIDADLIPQGDVDERPIQEVTADDVRPYTQAHFFAGIGGWAYAARLAGWPDERPLWTGSCPCQPFSNAGKRLAYSDPRNLWPDFARLIQDCHPPAVLGEQVASKAGRLWLAGVREDLEALGYAVGAADLCAAGVGAPHIRQRLWWVADAECGTAKRHGHEVATASRGMQETPREQRIRDHARDGSAAGGLGHPQQPRLEGHAGHGADGHEPGRKLEDAAGSTPSAGGDCGLSDAEPQRRQQGHSNATGSSGRDSEGEVATPWSNSYWCPCADGKARRIEPGIEPLVDGFPGRVDQVRAYGNSICPQEAAEFIAAYIEIGHQPTPTEATRCRT